MASNAPDLSAPLRPATGSAHPNSPRSHPSVSSAQAVRWVFIAVLAVAFPVILFGVGGYQWFFRDDFFFITGRQLSASELFRPYDSHWSTLLIIEYRVLWRTFGFRTYVPYEAATVALHLTAALLLRMVMRRAGVGPWIATAAAGSFIFFGPGHDDIIWGFQVGFTGALVLGLTQLLLCDRDGPIDRRDALGVLAGALALMSSGIGVVMAVVVGLTVLVRRGWRAAAMCTLPLGVMYFAYLRVEHPSLTGPFGRPSLRVLYRWIRSSESGAFLGIGHYSVLAIGFAVLLVVRLAIAIGAGRLQALRGRLAASIALLVGGVVFAVSTGEERWIFGPSGARASRYVYVAVAFALPALAVAADAIARRWRVLTPVLAALFLLAIPANIREFNTPPFDASYFRSEERILTTVTRLRAAREVPGDVRPIPDIYLSPGLNIGFLRRAVRDGRLDQSAGPIHPKEANADLIRLGLSQTSSSSLAIAPGCATNHTAMLLDPSLHRVYGFDGAISITTVSGGQVTSTPVEFSPFNGTSLIVELPGLHLRVGPAFADTSFSICRAG